MHEGTVKSGYIYIFWMRVRLGLHIQEELIGCSSLEYHAVKRALLNSSCYNSQA